MPQFLSKISEIAKNRSIGLFVLFVLLLVLGSCESEKPQNEKPKSPRIRKKIEWQTPKNGTEFSRNTNLELAVLHRDDIEIDSVEFSLQKVRKAVSGNASKIDLSNLEVGRHTISATTYFNGEKEISYSTIVILAPEAPTEYAYQIKATYPHDPDAYIQGLFFQGDTLYESTGLQTSQNPKSISSLRKYIYSDGKIIERYDLDKSYFGEGCTIWNNQLFQLTYTSKTAFVYDKSFNVLRSHQFETETTEGWGLITYGDTLIISDGSEKLYFVDPRNFSEFRRMQVYDHEGPVRELNEMELIEGKIYANLWTKVKTVIIDPQTGIVEGVIDFDGIVSSNLARNSDYAMNGIAYHPDKRIFVTGKWWPELYEIVIFPKEKS